jgi:hypothetical protein
LESEPAKEDFVSPCLQVVDLMSRFSANDQLPDFEVWFRNFLPQFYDKTFALEPGVSFNNKLLKRILYLMNLNLILC